MAVNLMNREVIDEMMRRQGRDERRSIREQFVRPKAAPAPPHFDSAYNGTFVTSAAPSELPAPQQHGYPQPTRANAVFQTPDFKDRMEYFGEIAKHRKSKDAGMARVVVALAGGAVEAMSAATGTRKMRGFRKNLTESVDGGNLESVIELFSRDQYKFWNNPWLALALALGGVVFETMDDNGSRRARRAKNKKKHSVVKKPVYESDHEESEAEEAEAETEESEAEAEALPRVVRQHDGSTRPHFGATNSDEETPGIFTAMTDSIGPGARELVQHHVRTAKSKKILEAAPGRPAHLKK